MSRGSEIATRALSAAAVGMEQQPEVAAFHQVEAISDQADRAIAEIVGLPGAAREAAEGEEDFRDLAIACLIETTIERPQGEEEPLPPRPGQGCRNRAGISSRQSAPEAKRRVGAEVEQPVKGENDARRLPVRRLDDVQAEQIFAPLDQALGSLFGNDGTERRCINGLVGMDEIGREPG